MALTLNAAPSSAAPRGDATVQPAYFTSSLFVDALRVDVRELARVFTEDYSNAATNARTAIGTVPLKPFALFKAAWIRLGWQWLHLKVFEPRARETFVNVVLRLFLECTVPTEAPLMRVVGLFGLYTFYMSQPSSSTPEMYTVTGIPIPLDTLESLLDFPASLTDLEEALRPHTIYVLQTIRPKFLVLPPTTLYAQNPRSLPREVLSSEVETTELTEGSTGKKKTGRPSKAEKAQRVRAAVSGLDRWLEKSSYPATDAQAAADPAGAAGRLRDGSQAGAEAETGTGGQTTHIMLSQRPITSLNTYRAKKTEVISALDAGGGGDALDRAGSRVLNRLKEIDAAAAERGLEVGTEGGALSGIERVESAVGERRVLGLLEGGGLSST
ncbi:hypothetical protein DFH11DRAFT_1557421 [Phellopilus nigrolimitatus]|nr:hypothetical protein DFH11DRAFT_1557421 [Phellopilus nigrolimitatus]